MANQPTPRPPQTERQRIAGKRNFNTKRLRGALATVANVGIQPEEADYFSDTSDGARLWDEFRLAFELLLSYRDDYYAGRLTPRRKRATLPTLSPTEEAPAGDGTPTTRS